MSRILILPLILLAIGISACGSHLTNTPNETSLIVITTAGLNPQPISAPGGRAAITMHVGDQRMIAIKRNVTSASGTTTTDVTATADYNFSVPTVASMDVGGSLTALTVGFTAFDVVFRDNQGDPTTDDKVGMDITVIP